jgi:outer membrane lipoprotein-sorting protein
MRSSLIFALVLMAPFCFARDPAEELYVALERHLQSLKSLEIHYEAQGQAVESEPQSGRLLWARPDRFFHDTPEWSWAEVGAERWRYLKSQNTLIREDVRDDQSAWLPDEMLFNLRRSFRAGALDERQDGRRVLHLQPVDEATGGEAALEFAAGAPRPDALEFSSPDGQRLRYRLITWRENIPVDSSVFSPPDVPAENVMDFRGAGQGR